jgi:hypothetical protein
MEEVLRDRLPRDVIRIIKKFVGPKKPLPSPPPSPYMTAKGKQVQKIRNSPKLTAMAFYLFDDDEIEV